MWISDTTRVPIPAKQSLPINRSSQLLGFMHITVVSHSSTQLLTRLNWNGTG